jgi:hypothetical protein
MTFGVSTGVSWFRFGKILSIGWNLSIFFYAQIRKLDYFSPKITLQNLSEFGKIQFIGLIFPF